MGAASSLVVPDNIRFIDFLKLAPELTKDSKLDTLEIERMFHNHKNEDGVVDKETFFELVEEYVNKHKAEDPIMASISQEIIEAQEREIKDVQVEEEEDEDKEEENPYFDDDNNPYVPHFRFKNNKALKRIRLIDFDKFKAHGSFPRYIRYRGENGELDVSSSGDEDNDGIGRFSDSEDEDKDQRINGKNNMTHGSSVPGSAQLATVSSKKAQKKLEPMLGSSRKTKAVATGSSKVKGMKFDIVERTEQEMAEDAGDFTISAADVDYECSYIIFLSHVWFRRPPVVTAKVIQDAINNNSYSDADATTPTADGKSQSKDVVLSTAEQPVEATCGFEAKHSPPTNAGAAANSGSDFYHRSTDKSSDSMNVNRRGDSKAEEPATGDIEQRQVCGGGSDVVITVRHHTLRELERLEAIAARNGQHTEDGDLPAHDMLHPSEDDPNLIEIEYDPDTVLSSSIKTAKVLRAQAGEDVENSVQAVHFAFLRRKHDEAQQLALAAEAQSLSSGAAQGFSSSAQTAAAIPVSPRPTFGMKREHSVAGDLSLPQLTNDDAKALRKMDSVKRLSRGNSSKKFQHPHPEHSLSRGSSVKRLSRANSQKVLDVVPPLHQQRSHYFDLPDDDGGVTHDHHPQVGADAHTHAKTHANTHAHGNSHGHSHRPTSSEAKHSPRDLDHQHHHHHNTHNTHSSHEDHHHAHHHGHAHGHAPSATAMSSSKSQPALPAPSKHSRPHSGRGVKGEPLSTPSNGTASGVGLGSAAVPASAAESKDGEPRQGAPLLETPLGEAKEGAEPVAVGPEEPGNSVDAGVDVDEGGMAREVAGSNQGSTAARGGKGSNSSKKQKHGGKFFDNLNKVKLDPSETAVAAPAKGKGSSKGGPTGGTGGTGAGAATAGSSKRRGCETGKQDGTAGTQSMHKSKSTPVHLKSTGDSEAKVTAEEEAEAGVSEDTAAREKRLQEVLVPEPLVDGDPYPDTEDNAQYKLCVDGIQKLRDTALSKMRKVYIWMDYCCTEMYHFLPRNSTYIYIRSDGTPVSDEEAKAATSGALAALEAAEIADGACAGAAAGLQAAGALSAVRRGYGDITTAAAAAVGAAVGAKHDPDALAMLAHGKKRRKALPLGDIMSICDALFTPLFDADKEWELPTKITNYYEDYHLKPWNLGPVAYLNRAWCRMEMFYATNVPLLPDLAPEKTSRRNRIGSRLKNYAKNENRPHILFGTFEERRGLPPMIIPPLPNNFLDKYAPMDGWVSVDSDKTHPDLLPKLQKELEQYLGRVRLGYQGDLSDNGKMDGHGVYNWENGDSYVGEWKNGKRHGVGTFTYHTGDVYDGEFKMGREFGLCTVKYADGNKYFGEIRKGKKSGHGVLEYANGDVYEGDFHKDARHGKGKMRYVKGLVYEGEFKHDMRHGKGVLKERTGQKIFVGEWRYDAKEEIIGSAKAAADGSTSGKSKTATGAVAGGGEGGAGGAGGKAAAATAVTTTSKGSGGGDGKAGHGTHMRGRRKSLG